MAQLLSEPGHFSAKTLGTGKHEIEDAFIAAAFAASIEKQQPLNHARTDAPIRTT